MSAQSIRYLAFLARSVGRDPEEPTGQSTSSPALGDLLREWRAAERRLADLDPGSDAWAYLQVEIEALRQRYQDAFDAMTDTDPTGSST
jgi:hypothetical protein